MMIMSFIIPFLTSQNMIVIGDNPSVIFIAASS